MPVDYEIIPNDWPTIEARVKQLQKDGWEGGMFRHPIISYVEGGTRTLLKLKFPNEGNFKIIDFTEGTNSYSNTLGALWVEGMGLDDSKNEILIRSKVSSGLSRDLRREIWADKETYVGVGVRLTYQKATPIDSDGYGSLRFPRFQYLMQNCEFIRL
jgi:ATP-dependent DNA ligase